MIWNFLFRGLLRHTLVLFTCFRFYVLFRSWNVKLSFGSCFFFFFYSKDFFDRMWFFLISIWVHECSIGMSCQWRSFVSTEVLYIYIYIYILCECMWVCTLIYTHVNPNRHTCTQIFSKVFLFFSPSPSHSHSLYIYVCVCVCPSFKHVWFSYKKELCLYDFIRIISSLVNLYF